MYRYYRYVGHLQHPGTTEEILVNARDVLQFKIQVVSSKPRDFPPCDYVSGFANELESQGFVDLKQGTWTDRKFELRDFMNGKVLTFSVDKPPRTSHVNARELKLYDIGDLDYTEYVRVPVVDLDRLTRPFEEYVFERLTVPGLRTHEEPNRPALVICDGHFYGPFRLQPVHDSFQLLPYADGWGRVPAIADQAEILGEEQEWFVAWGRFHGLIEELREARLANPRPEPVVSVPSAAPPSASSADGSLAPLSTSRTALAVLEVPTRVEGREPASAGELSEDAFLDRLERVAYQEQLLYRSEDLIAFHTAIKSGGLVVLAGLSGTGKSRLIDCYRKALGLPADQHRWLAVRPNWHDDSDVLGYLDPVQRLYRPSDTGLVDLLVEAERHPDRLYLIALDEMNLARVEHYLAPFLSLLERSEQDRRLELYSAGAEPYNRGHYPPALRLGPNLLWAGTVNVDESTHGFSDKVLDRADVLRLGHVSLRTWYEQERARGSAAATGSAGDAAGGWLPVSAEVYRSWLAPAGLAAGSAEVNFLERLNEVIGGVAPHRRFGYRVARSILEYLNNLPQRAEGKPNLTRAQALDRQVAQRILPKLRGSLSEVGPLLEESGPLVQLLTESGEFPESLLEISHRDRELKTHGFIA